MKRALGLGALLLSSSIGFAADAGFSDDQKKAIEKMIHEYLVKQPEVLIEASQALQKKQQDQMQAEVQSLIQANAKDLFQDQYTTVGNPKGAVTVVEFFDYQCGHCRKMGPVMEEVIKQAPNLRIVYKEFPIFGEGSVTLAKAALAAAMQGKYMQMHDALLSASGRLKQDDVIEIAKKLKLDIPQFKKDMEGEKVKKALDENRKLGEAIHLMGTPAFIVAATPEGGYKENPNKPVVFIPGATSKANLMELAKKLG